MLRRIAVLPGTLILAILASCGGQGASAAGTASGSADSAGTAGNHANQDMAGGGGSAGGPSGTLPHPPGCASGVIGSQTACVAAAQAWAWVSSAGGTSTAAGGVGGEAAQDEVGGGGAETETSTPEGCPDTHLIRAHVELTYGTVYDGGTRMGDECCYTSFQPCG